MKNEIRIKKVATDQEYELVNKWWTGLGNDSLPRGADLIVCTKNDKPVGLFALSPVYVVGPMIGGESVHDSYKMFGLLRGWADIENKRLLVLCEKDSPLNPSCHKLLSPFDEKIQIFDMGGN